MKRLLLLAAAFACTPSDAPPPDQPSQPPQPSAAAGTDSLPSMPDYPEAGRGWLAAGSAGPAGEPEITGEWRAEAGTCRRPPMLQLVAQEPGTGTIILLALPPDNRVTRYPVTLVQQGLPDPPAAQVGVNIFRPVGSFAYQAAEGAVEVYALDRVVSGRFAVTLREINTNKRLRYAGAFREVPVKELDPSRCSMADSVAAAR